MVTLLATDSLDRPLHKAVRPLLAAVDNPIAACGDFTMADVMFTMRPKPRDFMPSMTLWIMKVGASRLACRAAFHSAWPHCCREPGGGPALLFTRMSGSGQAASN